MQVGLVNKKWEYSKLVLHRGGGIHAPENTLAALRFAADAKIEMVEVDVRLSADGKAFLFHDDSLDRTTDASGAAQALSWDEWQTIDAGSWRSDKFAGEAVPLFTDAINYVQREDLLINIELKPFKFQSKETAECVAGLLKQYWSKPTLPLISSFNLDSLRVMYKLAPIYPRGILLDEWDDHWLTLAQELKPISLHLNAAVLTSERVAQIKEQGLYILAYTVNSPDLAKKLLEWGVDSICTDNAYLF